MYGYIYMTINLVNNKKYIGQHKSNVFNSTNYIGSGKILKNAINKYGKENFDCILLEECNNKAELNEREKYWISYYNAVDSNDFYNLSFGGNGGDLSDFIDYSKSVRLREDNWNYGKHYKWFNDGIKDIRVFDGDEVKNNYLPGRLYKMSKSAKEKISTSRLGKSPANKGIPMSEDQRLKVSNSRKGKCCGDNNPSRRPDVINKLKKRYICPICEKYISTKSCITRHIRKNHLNYLESASTIESIDWEKYSIE